VNQNNAGIHDVGVLTYPTIVVIASLLLDRPSFVVALLLTGISVGWLALGEWGGLFTPLLPDSDLLGADLVTAVVALAVTAITARLMSTSLVQSLEQAKTEIAARQLAENDLRRSEEELRAIVSHLPLVFFVLDGEGTFVVLEGRGLQMLHMDPDGIVGQSAFAVYRDKPDICAHVQLALDGESSRAIHNIDDVLLDVHYTPRHDGQDRRGVIGVAIDVTDRVRAETRVRMLNVELEQRVAERTAQLESASQEMEAFAYSVSHDLRAPLRAIGGFTKVVSSEYAPQLVPEAQRYLGLVEDNVERMGRLIDGLLTLSRLGRQDLHKETVSPTGVAEQVVAHIRDEEGDRQVEVTVDDLPPCQADPVLLRQVYANLLSNAFKFTREQETARIKVGCERQNGQPVYYVRDNGTGFDMRYADKVFDVFQRLHREQDFEGTGIGLAIVQRIVRRHGGRVWATAEPGQGATFYFCLGDVPAAT
jgi:PAS domain S-box-containing protein